MHSFSPFRSAQFAIKLFCDSFCSERPDFWPTLEHVFTDSADEEFRINRAVYLAGFSKAAIQLRIRSRQLRLGTSTGRQPTSGGNVPIKIVAII
jgi:hypothetical protein